MRRSDRYRAFEVNLGDRFETDDELLEFARHYGQTACHVVRTCKMGHEPMAVVHDQLRVHGVTGPQVVDASIIPKTVSGNTNAPVIMIAEKGADPLGPYEGVSVLIVCGDESVDLIADLP